jgi:hypothetical protein
MMRKQINDDLLRNLEEQKREKQLRMEEENRERYRRANGDFYKNFGTSCR